MSDDYSGWIRISQPSCNSSCLVIRETCGLTLSWWKILHFMLTNSRRFSSSAAFSWFKWEKYLLELIIWFSEKEFIPFQSHHIHTITFLGWKLAFLMVGVGSFHLPHSLFHLHYCTVSTFHCLSKFILKIKCLITFK